MLTKQASSAWCRGLLCTGTKLAHASQARQVLHVLIPTNCCKVPDPTGLRHKWPCRTSGLLWQQQAINLRTPISCDLLKIVCLSDYAPNYLNKMSIPNEALQKVPSIDVLHTECRLSLKSLQLVQEIESQAILAQREINVVKTAISAKQRDVRLLELTTTEVRSLPKDTNVYEGVGKM